MKNTIEFWCWSVMEVSAAIFLISLTFRKKVLYIPCTEVSVSILLFILWVVLSLLWTPNFHATLTGIVKLIFIFMMLIIFSNEPNQWQKAIQKIVIACSIGTVLLYLLFPNSDAITKMNYPNLMGGFLAAGGILSCAEGLDSEKVKKVALLLMSLAIGFCLLLFASLGPIIAWLAGAALIFLIVGRKSDKIWFLICVGLFGLILFSNQPQDQLRINTVVTRRSTDPFAFERIQIWKDSFRYFMDHPIVGTGLGTYRDYYPQYKTIEGLRIAPYAHNEFINLACETGAIGVVLAIWLAILLIKQLIVKTEEIKIWGKWGAVALGILVHSFFDFNLHYPPILLLLVFFTALLVSKREIELKSNKLKIVAASIAGLFGIFAALPGVADVIFKNADKKGINEQKAAAQSSAKIDFFNGIYRFRTGRMRDLLIAIDLEPRNVWYRREAARYFTNEWKKTNDAKFLHMAREQYSQILLFAPGVKQFLIEAQETFEADEAVQKIGLFDK